MYGNSNLDSGTDLAKEQKGACVPWIFRRLSGIRHAANTW
jgi:hypothetical protein